MWHRDFYENGAQKYFSEVPKTMLNLNIHTSYISHAVNYSHEHVIFWYVWNIRTANYEILIGTSFSQMPNFICVKNSHVFVTSVRIRSNFSHVWQMRANSSHVWQIRSNVKVKWICHMCVKFERICHTCEEFMRLFHRYDKYVLIPHFCEGLARIFQMWQIRANPSLLWRTRTNLSHVW